MREKAIDEIIRLTLTGDATAEDITQLNTWLAQSEENQQVYRHLQLIWDERSVEPQLPQTEEIRDRIWQEGMSGTTEPLRSQSANYRSYILYYSKIAAMVLLALALLLFLYNRLPKSIPTQARLMEKSCPPGKQLKARLPDGSVAWLNADSRIRFLEGFEGTTRTVELVGEAYFEVAKNPQKPFIVKSSQVSTTAIGTSFNITAYPDDSLIQVALLSGKVKVDPPRLNAKAAAFFLERGEGFDFDKSTNRTQTYQIDASTVLAWQHGILVFDGDSFEGVTKKLSRWYGVNITVTGAPPQDWKLTGRFTNEKLTEVLESIRFGRDFSYDLTANQLAFHF